MIFDVVLGSRNGSHDSQSFRCSSRHNPSPLPVRQRGAHSQRSAYERNAAPASGVAAGRDAGAIIGNQTGNPTTGAVVGAAIGSRAA